MRYAHDPNLGRRVKVRFDRHLNHYPWTETTWKTGTLQSAIDAGVYGTCVEWDEGGGEWIAESDRIVFIEDGDGVVEEK